MDATLCPVIRGQWKTVPMVFMGGRVLCSWLFGQVADAGRRRLGAWAFGTDQERALRAAAHVAAERARRVIFAREIRNRLRT